MKEPYELTIIISNYNQEKHLSETIESVLSQKTNFPYKIIITDDHSCKDRSKEIIKDYAKKYDNIEPIFSEENKGYLYNILRAKAHTKTKYFCLLDADDYWTDPFFLQLAYDFLENHNEYVIYEANVEVVSENGQNKHPLFSSKYHSCTYSKEMLLNDEIVPITQTTGMVFRNCIFIYGIPDVMKKAVGTRSERSFEGDTGRFIMHLKYGLAYFDSRIVGVYRQTENGIWTSLSTAKKKIISARMQLDFYDYYESNVDFFANKCYRFLQAYLVEKQRELTALSRTSDFIDEYENKMLNDVYDFCKLYEKEINVRKNGIKERIKQMLGFF